MVRVARIFLFALVLLAPGPLMATSLQQHYLNVYLEINDAQHLEAAKDYLGAMVCYGMAERILAKLHERFPDWEPELIIKRVRIATRRPSRCGPSPRSSSRR